MLWWVPGPRAGQRWVQLPFGAFWSPAGGIDPAPSIPVMHGAGSPALMSPWGRGWDMGAGGGSQGWGHTAARPHLHQARGVTLQGHRSLLQLLAQEMLWASVKMSRAAAPPRSCCSPAHKITACHDRGDPGIPYVPSCTPRPHSPKARAALALTTDPTQWHCHTPSAVSPSSSSAMGKVVSSMARNGS